MENEQEPLKREPLKLPKIRQQNLYGVKKPVEIIKPKQVEESRVVKPVVVESTTQVVPNKEVVQTAEESRGIKNPKFDTDSKSEGSDSSKLDEIIIKDPKGNPVTRRNMVNKYGFDPTKDDNYKVAYGVNPENYESAADYGNVVLRALAQSRKLAGIGIGLALFIRNKAKVEWEASPETQENKRKIDGQRKNLIEKQRLKADKKLKKLGVRYSVSQLEYLAREAGEKMYGKTNKNRESGEGLFMGEVEDISFIKLSDLIGGEEGEDSVGTFEYIFFPSNGAGKDVSDSMWEDADKSWIDIDGKIYTMSAENNNINVIEVDRKLLREHDEN